MQCLARKFEHLPAKRIGQPVRLGEERLSIVSVADQGVADMRHMNPDLMRPACFEPAFDQRGHE